MVITIIIIINNIIINIDGLKEGKRAAQKLLIIIIVIIVCSMHIYLLKCLTLIFDRRNPYWRDGTRSKRPSFQLHPATPTLKNNLK